MTGPGWLRKTGPDQYRIERIDPCEAGTCGHARCPQVDDQGEYIQREIDRADAWRDRNEP